jgi:exo-1,4-beta-D-glucosaminidase
MLPKDNLWPIDDHWNFHAGGGQFKTLKIFTSALENRYGAAKDLQDYAMKSQLMAYEGQRAMFEGFAANRFQSSGVIQWMLNNAWPSMIWHLYDYYLMPAGGYFATKMACEPVHVQYSSQDKSIVIVNTTLQDRKDLKLTIGVYDLTSQEKFSQTINVDVPAESNVKTAVLPDIKDLSPTFFVKLTLEDRQQVVSRNFYWLSSTEDVLDWEKSTWYYTPTTSYADMTQLKNLPELQLKISATKMRQGVGREVAHITVSNPSSSLAFFIHLQIQPGRNGETVVPIIWQDNYISLLPGESRDVTASYELKHVAGQTQVLVAQGWNSARVEIPLRWRSK